MRRLLRSSADGFGVAWMLVALGLCCQAQNQTPFTLHAYANVTQIPVLVLDYERKPMKTVDPKSFLVSLDSGKFFPPAHVRLEGEDPIDLAILLDVSGSQRLFAQGFVQAVPRLVPVSLHAGDQVTVYVLGCNLVRSTYAIPPDAERLRTVLASALQAVQVGRRQPACHRPMPLKVALGKIAGALSHDAGRRVILAVSDGYDQSTQFTWGDLQSVANNADVTIFGLVAQDVLDDEWTRGRLKSICELTGGMMTAADPNLLPKHLQEFVALLRGRYIVEFPRPRGIGAGSHSIQVKLRDNPMAFVRASGISVPLPDPKLLADPTTIPSEAGADIPVGKRRPLPPN